MSGTDHENPFPFLPEGHYLGRIRDVYDWESPATGRRAHVVVSEVLDSQYKGQWIWVWCIKPEETTYENTTFIWDKVFPKISKDIIGEDVVLAVTVEDFQQRKTNKATFLPVPEHVYKIDMTLTVIGPKPLMGANSPHVARALDESLQGAMEGVRKAGLLVRRVGSGYRVVGPTQSTSHPANDAPEAS